jgi:hypothetical protein
MPVSDDEKTILAPAMRRACVLMVHWLAHDMQGITCILSEMVTVSDATDTILALLVLQDNVHDNPYLECSEKSTLLGIAQCAALKEATE